MICESVNWKSLCIGSRTREKTLLLLPLAAIANERTSEPMASFFIVLQGPYCDQVKNLFCPHSAFGKAPCLVTPLKTIMRRIVTARFRKEKRERELRCNALFDLNRMQFSYGQFNRAGTVAAAQFSSAHHRSCLLILKVRNSG